MVHSQFLEIFWASVKETIAATMKSGYILDLAGDRYDHGSRRNHDHRVHLKERSCPYPATRERGRYDDGSDHSLSSLSSAREHMLPEAGAAHHFDVDMRLSSARLMLLS